MNEQFARRVCVTDGKVLLVSTEGEPTQSGWYCCDEYFCSQECLDKSFEGTDFTWETHFSDDGDCYYTDPLEAAVVLNLPRDGDTEVALRSAEKEDVNSSRVEGTYQNHAGDSRWQLEVTKFIHQVDGDTYQAPGNIRVVFTVREFGPRYMAFAEAFKGQSKDAFFSGNSLWHNSSMSLDEIDALIDSVIGLASLRKNFE